MFFPESIHITDTFKDGSILLREVASDNDLDRHLPLTPASQKFLFEGAAQNAAQLRDEIAGDNGALWGIYPLTKGELAASPVGGRCRLLRG